MTLTEMRKDLITKKHSIGSQICDLTKYSKTGGEDVVRLREELANIDKELANNPEQPEDGWEKAHGIWFESQIAEQIHPGTLVFIDRLIYVFDGEKMVYGVIVEPRKKWTSAVVLLDEKGCPKGCKECTPRTMWLYC